MHAAYFGFSEQKKKQLSKRRIMELYANVIEMGDGIYGVRGAAVGVGAPKAPHLSLQSGGGRRFYGPPSTRVGLGRWVVLR